MNARQHVLALASRLLHRGRVPLLLLVCFHHTGCCRLQPVVDSLSHWQENRCSCLPGSHLAPVAVATPAGYLTEGATFGGETITGPPSKTAVDELLELNQQVKQLQDERQQLLQRLETAQQTIQQQGSAIDAASKELQYALTDYLTLRDGLAGWHSELNQLDEQVRLEQRQQDQLMDRLEADLQDILTRCEGRSDQPPSVSLVAPRNRTAARQVEAAER